MDRGRAVPRMHRWTNPVRGRVTIAEERDPDRGRVVRMARLQAPGQEAQALYDVQLVGGTGEAWTLAGYERVLAGPLAEAVPVAQAWALKPAPDADLERAEAELQRLRRLVGQLQKGGSSAAGTGGTSTHPEISIVCHGFLSARMPGSAKQQTAVQRLPSVMRVR